MNTFSQMADEWLRANPPTAEPPQSAPDLSDVPLDWQPGDAIIPAFPETELTKLTKTNSVSFGSAISGQTQIISDDLPAHAPDGDPDEWAADFVAWIDANCVHRPGMDDWTAVSTLHIAFCESQIARDSVPCTRNAFESLLRQLGCRFSNGMVSGFLLKTDLEAVLQGVTVQ
jgi:hypothetical protein